jgi:cellulose synthase/poly-beta-1,6-N-acetylglucosamine synthase-like glycosyltransferase
MISIIITSFNEPKTIGKAIESIINQKIKEEYELYISAPDEPTLEIAKQYQEKNKQIEVFIDPGQGKSYAINLLMPKLKGRIIILTDGDVYVSEDSINKIIDLFKNEKVGCVTGRPVSIEKRNHILGYWSHMLCDSAHKLRSERNRIDDFLECSGYFWAFRNNVIKEFPLDVAEDTIVPCFFWRKGFKIKYSPKSEVFVSFPDHLDDYMKQKKRTIKAHEKIHRYVKNPPKMKTFSNELLGLFFVLNHAKGMREFVYALLAVPLRGYLWFSAYREYLMKTEYSDAWDRVESTK